MPNYGRGLYEALITESSEVEIEGIETSPSLKVVREELRRAEVGDRLALHLSRLINNAVNGLTEPERIERGIRLARKLVELLSAELDDEQVLGDRPILNRSVLSKILKVQPNGHPEAIIPPLIPLLDTTLLTNSPGEPRVGHQIQTEIESATQIDVVMAFIRASGIQPFLGAFRRHCEAGRRLRVLTTTYTNSTEQRALEALEGIGAEVRVSYDTSGTRLHAKSWLFHRPGGMSTAYIGSSNLTHQAQRTGLEWNVRISGARNPAVIEKVEAVFSVYWESGDFEKFDAMVFASRVQVEGWTPDTFVSAAAIRLFPFQERMLEQIAVARERGHHKNLLVSATGTGKTVMAAVDYARLRTILPRARLLFIAHTIDILKQSLATFRHAVSDGEFGELWVAGFQPHRWENVFASIQSIAARGLEHLEPDYFDVVIIDEVHHGAAPTYISLLDYIKPRELLGLTATPERADGDSILGWFGDRIASELRLWDAIDQHRLVPFDYYGVHDGTDLSQIPWRRGSGYDVEGLTNLYTADDLWANKVIQQLKQRVTGVSEMRALGFCVSIEHARFMARIFNERNIRALAVWGDSPREERTAALRKLNAGEINILFSVDIFNEGVDVPNVDTLLFLRPTDSPVLFLQQLGRGLRKSRNKAACLVLDFVGQHRKEFRFHRKLQAFLGGSRKFVEEQVESDFPFLPAGCHMQLESQAKEIVLRNIRNAIPNSWAAKARELRALSAQGVTGMAEFLERSGLELTDIYQGAEKCWSDLKEEAGLRVEPNGPSEAILRRACGRMLHVDNAARLNAYKYLLQQNAVPSFNDLETEEARIARMLVASVAKKATSRDQSLRQGLELLWQHPQLRAELVELFEFLKIGISHQHCSLANRQVAPLQLHARYTRTEILAALDVKDSAHVPEWREGVRWIPSAGADVFAFTLDKTSGQFSPTTRYRDYAISPTLIHWESQSTTRANSETGLRYQRHVEMGTDIYLFARESVRDSAYWFLGPATFESFEGERPMAITWRLESPLPGDLFATFVAAVA